MSDLLAWGQKTAEIFALHGIRTIEDFLYFLPRGWIDASTPREIKDLRIGQSALIQVQVVTVRPGISQRTRKPYLKATVADTSGSLSVMWFHAPYLKQKVKPGAQFMLYGKLQGWRREDAVMMSPRFITTPSIIPVYPEIGGLASYKTHRLMQQLTDVVMTYPDYLPESIAVQHNLLPLGETLRRMHFPSHVNEILEAKKRLGFDELLMLMVPSLLTRRQRAREQTDAFVGGNEVITQWCASLPFALTQDQQRVIQEILESMASPQPMNRLVQGDVGSGKTVVGLAAAYQAILHKKQVAWLAPTELLAKQHFATAQKMYQTLGISIGLWTRTSHYIADSQERKASLDEVLAQPFIIGTHALLADSVVFPNLGLLIIDEQHRFGVKQRAQLRMVGGKPVHLLSMTATPIPRTMALLLYGDLRLSTIKEKPLGRKPVITRVVEAQNRDKAYQFVDELMSKGKQAFVVCPTIEPSQDDEANLFTSAYQTLEDKKSVTTWYAHLAKRFPHRRIAMLHGKLKPKEKEAVMESFRGGTVDMLVTTTVIEVGVDVPNAQIMLIEAADRFGLAQLHQLRGRVGRSDEQAFCLLFPSDETQTDHARLKCLEETTDGFVLAEKDLQLRGPGEITGWQQSGIPPLRFASLQDSAQVEAVRTITEGLLDNEQFQASLQRFWRLHHPE